MIKFKSNARKVSIDLRNAANVDTTPLMREIAGDLEDITETAFQKESDPVTGRPWKALARATIKYRTRIKKWPGKKLQVFGMLAGRIQTDFSRTKARIGSSVEYAGFVQDRRRFIGLSRIHKKKIKKKAALFVLRSIRKRGQ